MAGSGSRQGRALEVDPAGGSGDAAGGREAADNDLAHEAAGRENLGISEPVTDRASVPDGLHQADGAHRGEVLGDGRLSEAKLVGELVDLARPLAEEVDEPEPVGARERAEERCL